MLPLGSIVRFLHELAPLRLAEDWDNVGLLVGDANRGVQRLMTCLTITPATAGEAVAESADLVVSHHPLPFRPLPRLTTETTPGRLLLDLAAARIAVYSPHTAWDSAAEGINEQLAQRLGLRGIAPLVPAPEGQGTGRWGWLEDPLSFDELADRVRHGLHLAHVQAVGPAPRTIRTVAVACGAAGELLAAARQAGCDAMVTGETNFHTCLEAEACDVGLILTGHYASERLGVEHLAQLLAAQFPGLEVWASRAERDPLRWVP
jgi:dinuclear metal center YbgI/SA1388 family protein